MSQPSNSRLILLKGAHNFRDIGGYRSQNGKEVRWHVVYRADGLQGLSKEDCVRLARLRITRICDLRTIREQQLFPDIVWEGAQHYDCHLYPEYDHSYAFSDLNQLRKKYNLPVMATAYADIYQRVLLSKEAQACFVKIFKLFLDLPAGEAMVLHCSAGKDRTGMMVALILMGLGVPDKTIQQDYLLSNDLAPFSFGRREPTNDELLALVNKMNVTKGEAVNIKGFTDTIRAGWGNFDNFFIKVLGFSQADLQAFRKKLLA